jgi:RNA 3'-terminal phosphate cyclase-like protein
MTTSFPYSPSSWSLPISYSVRVASQFSNRLVESSRSLLNPLIPDIHIFTDHRKAEESGKSQAYGLSLVSTTTTGTMHCAEISHDLSLFETPEDVGRAAAASLLSDIRKGGCVGEYGQGLVLMGMVLGSEDVGRVRLGELSANSYVLLSPLSSYFQPCVEKGR